MADTKISALSSGSAVTDTDVFPAVETAGVGPVKKTATQIKTYAQQGVLKASNNLSDLSSVSSARSFLGLGTAALVNYGTGANELLQLTSAAKYPALDGSLITNIPKYTDKLSAFALTYATELATVINGKTGSGDLVFASSPTLVSPALGNATATTVNKISFTAPVSGATLTLANNSTFATSGAFSVTLTATATTSLTLPTSGTLATTSAKLSDFASTTSAELAGVISDETGSGKLVFATSPTLTTPNIGTPSAGTLTNCTGLPIGSGISGLGSGVATFLGTPSSANLRSALTDKTGTGSAVFSNSPTFEGDITLGGVASATGVVKINGTTSGTVSVSVADAAGTWTLKLPTSAGTNGYVLSTDGFGNTSWIAQSGGGGGGSPGGSDTQVQYNDAGSFGGSATFAWDKANDRLTIGKSSTKTGKIRLGHVTSAHYTTIQAGNATSAVTYTLPTADGATGAYLQTNGAGALTWNSIPDPVAMALVFGS